ncbi:MAG TPA: magnesium/cobalt transporter CorA [Candidatus Competibacteraceae bacterium]|nr:MAG: magnesium/cobalt transporter CorA [Candidatus Competibacteraceae bacterium]HOB62435.1 magnesium/cobalt transporter CorA [Candidatus Competibacteraceae bacterium]HQA25857.1 magnesium/cobalt transporter CorA [Candidatus Competibacteraceae bacterium]HQD57202.1 magnesium/cobalt transporter CorA [Candidatus Competibacteraceae bacterium]
MINVFALQNGRLRQIPIENQGELEQAKPIWIDFDEPTDEERVWARDLFGLTLPDEDDFGDIEASARCFEDASGSLQIRSDFLLDKVDEVRNVPVAFVLRQDILFSLHQEDLPVFRLLRMRARHQPGYLEDCRDVLLDLYATDAEYSADSLEGIYANLEEIGSRVLTAHLTDQDAADVLAGIAREEDLNGRIRRNLMDTRRAISFLMRRRLLSSEQIEESRQILRDIESLDGHTSFLFEKINFLMDATVGFININQNKIIKLFSVASVALLPPTLIASIYGMNFEFMPELKWPFGYPFALGLMVVSVIAPFWYFSKKGWLK